MKYISFIIPCYNSSEYMSKCIDSIIALGDNVEVLIVDDGSNKDNTLDIAKKYENKYPNICKAIHKENGGHGDALNVGIENATGLYLKVVDSDDWIDTDAGKKLLDTIIRYENNNQKIDLYVTNFIYDKVGAIHKKTMSYNSFLRENEILTWDNIRKFRPGTYLLMHSLCYRTEIVKKSNLNLPKKTFYVDNIYAYKPFLYVNNLYYLNINLYHYYIGREDQSVNEKIMISRLEQQYRVTNIMLYDVDLNKIQNKNLYNYMINYMSIIMTITSVFSILSKDEKWLLEKEKLWTELKNKNIKLYNDLHCSFLGISVNLPGSVGRSIAVVGYKISRALYGFN